MARDLIRWYIDTYLGGYDSFLNKSADKQATIYEQAKEGARDFEGRKQYGPKWKELYESAGKPLPVMQEIATPSLTIGERKRDYASMPAMNLPDQEESDAPTWGEYPAEGAPAEEMKQYQENFRKYRAALPRVYGSDTSDSEVNVSNYEAARFAGKTGSELVAAVIKPDYVPWESRKLHSASRKAWNRDFDEAKRRESAASDKKHQAWRDKVAGETKKRYQVEDEEFKNKVAAQDKWYEEARARIAANNEKLKRMGLL